ncbi:MAG: hypothetical protein ACI9HE_000282 [Planctomycetota bacterium]|jgi:hypothetical protein
MGGPLALMLERAGASHRPGTNGHAPSVTLLRLVRAILARHKTT